MSTTYSIGCTKCQVKFWAGQTSGGGPMRIYNPEKGLASFLHQHIGHPLVFETDESGVIDEFQEYEQPPTEQT